MDPTSEDANEVVYVVGPVTYRIKKTDPPTLVVETYYGHPDQVAAGRPQTWQGTKDTFAEA